MIGNHRLVSRGPAWRVTAAQALPVGVVGSLPACQWGVCRQPAGTRPPRQIQQSMHCGSHIIFASMLFTSTSLLFECEAVRIIDCT